jgi:hypothetical protein
MTGAQIEQHGLSVQRPTRDVGFPPWHQAHKIGPVERLFLHHLFVFLVHHHISGALAD